MQGMVSLLTVKPVLVTTSEQRPTVYNNQPEPQFSKIESKLWECPINNDHFFEAQRWPLHTGLTVYLFCLTDGIL
jgi:hypothetical protein